MGVELICNLLKDGAGDGGSVVLPFFRVIDYHDH